MLLLIGPCMFLAPLVVLLIPVALVLWPPALMLVGLSWLVIAPLARVTGNDRLDRWTKKLGGWFRTLLTPWNYFDTPKAPPRPATDDTHGDA